MILKALVRSKLGNTVHRLEHILSVLKLAVKAELKNAYSQYHTLSTTLISDSNILCPDQDRNFRNTGKQVCCCTSANQY